jgi:hypothetical protein
MSRARARYPTKAAIARAVEMARALGLDVASIAVSPDGTVRTLPLAAVQAAPVGESDGWADFK